MTPAPNWCHPGTVLRVVDGDSIIVSLDLGKYPHKIRVEAPIRIAGLYAPEKRDPGGPEAAAFLVELFRDDKTVVVATRKPDPRDPYGRIVADVYAGGASVAAAVIAAGHGTATK